MRFRLLASSAALALALAVGGGVLAQEAAAGDAAAASDAPDAATDDSLLSEDELDELVAPIALYPDSLMTQVLVASTYPLDIVKADRFITQKADLTDKERAAEAEQQDWDPSVQVLTGGFPTVVQRMATEIDWTEDLGDAMLAQTDDLLDAVQRQRARAVAVGNLTSNDAQVVEQEDDNITIAPAAPDVVYVPQYDAATAYTTPYTAPPVIATADTGYSTSNLVTTGAIAFGSALLIDQIFDDDDDWDDYWGPGPSHIDWDDGDFRARPDIDVEGDVNINRNRNNVIVDRDRTNIDRDRIGALDPDRPGRAGDWNPSDKSRADARDRLAARERAGGDRPAAGTRTAADRAAAQDKLRARSGVDSGARKKLETAQATRRPPAAARAKDSALASSGWMPANPNRHSIAAIPASAGPRWRRRPSPRRNRSRGPRSRGRPRGSLRSNPRRSSTPAAARGPMPPRRAAARATAAGRGGGRTWTGHRTWQA